MGLIQLENMEFYAYHGCYREEQIVGNKFLVDLTVGTDMELPAKSDDINNALNYQVLYTIVKEQMAIQSHLLEHVAGRILDAIFKEFENLNEATVKVSKLNPPMGGKMRSVSVSLSRKG
jgi:7,8-dihydroneopterin aldolase/epimerase/oxygenase